MPRSTDGESVCAQNTDGSISSSHDFEQTQPMKRLSNFNISINGDVKKIDEETYQYFVTFTNLNYGSHIHSGVKVNGNDSTWQIEPISLSHLETSGATENVKKAILLLVQSHFLLDADVHTELGDPRTFPYIDPLY